MSEPLVCQHCGNKIAVTDGAFTVISLKVRGHRRRSYRLPAAVAVVVSCDWCDGEGAPITHTAFLTAREQGIQPRLIGSPA